MDKIYKLAKQFKKTSVYQLSDANIKRVVIDTYNELNVGPPNDIRIQYQKINAEGDDYTGTQKQLNVFIWSNSYLEPEADSTMQNRLHQVFDPEENLYNFYIKYYS